MKTVERVISRKELFQMTGANSTVMLAKILGKNEWERVAIFPRQKLITPWQANEIMETLHTKPRAAVEEG